MPCVGIGYGAGVATSGKRSDRLATYRGKRDFSRTGEPVGSDAGTETGNRFVVQRHRARRRHYDLRLEIGGALASWAVPKGPTLDASVKRLAVHVEDHPLEYADFEGVIPAGEYGGGDVVVWDRGRWWSSDGTDPATAIESGDLHFELRGEKLAGHFVLVRRGNGDSANWLLIHKDDEHAEPGWDAERNPCSVKSGRSNDEVAADPEAVWRSDLPAARAEQPPATRTWRGSDEDELAELDRLRSKGKWRFAGRELTLTNMDKVLFPATERDPAVTKRDLVRYCARIAPVMLPYLADRPLNAHRYPDGIEKAGFWHKEAPEHTPEWFRTWEHEDAGAEEARTYLVPEEPAALAWLANYGALELHSWTSRTRDVQRPTWALFDIDSGEETSFADVLVLARLHRTTLDHLGVQGRPKITGQRGIQVWVPVEPRYSYERTRRWTRAVSEAIGQVVPDLVSWAWQKSERRGKARLDYTQNVFGKTLVAPYSPRPKPGAPVSVPIEWDELDDPELTPDRWTIRTVFDRLAEVGDPFAPLLDVRQRLPEP